MLPLVQDGTAPPPTGIPSRPCPQLSWLPDEGLGLGDRRCQGLRLSENTGAHRARVGKRVPRCSWCPKRTQGHHALAGFFLSQHPGDGGHDGGRA